MKAEIKRVIRKGKIVYVIVLSCLIIVVGTLIAFTDNNIVEFVLGK
jgi:hypothetical protein